MHPQTTIPNKLRLADLTRFINRAAQLEAVEPIVSYWCEYWIVNQILAKGLHTEDPETYQFTTVLMDKLEQIKADNPTNDAILDDVAGQIYIERFAMETFQRAERAAEAKKATKQTASTFQAAATFFELINIWSPPDAETTAIIKYAKWNAVRILRAFSEGKDPNISSSKPEANDMSIFPKVESIDESINDCEGSTDLRLQSILEGSKATKELNNKISSAPITSPAQMLYPEDSTHAPEETHAIDNSPHKISTKAISTALENTRVLDKSYNHTKDSSEVSLFESEPLLPSQGAATLKPILDSRVSQPLPNRIVSHSITNFESFPPPKLTDREPVTFQNLDQESPQKFCVPLPTSSVESFQPSDQHQNILVTKQELGTKFPKKIRTDDISTTEAQKHARWAISALNFDDADTAVKELKEALKALGID